MRSYAEFRSIEQQLSAGEENPSEALEEATCYVTQMIEYADNILQASEDEELDEEAKDEQRVMVYSFVQSYLPSILQKVLKRKLSSPQVRSLAMTFLKEVVRLVVHWIPLDNINVIKLLVEIAGEDATFYQHKRNSGEYTKYPGYAGAMSPGMDSPLQEVESGRFTAAPYYRAPPALLELIEYFGELGGFEKVVERIREDSSKLDLKYATWYLKSGEKLRKWIKRSFLEEWVADMKDACYGHILGLTPDELKAVTKTVLIRTVELVHVLLVEVMTKEEAGCVTESFQLELSLKCLHSKSLEKRLQGLNAINQLIEMATRKESPPSSNYLYGQSMMRRGMPKSTDWLTTDFILEWLKKHEIVAELFGAKMHHELLKRANEIVKLFAEKEEFSLELLELLWNSSLGKQEATEAAIYLIIRDLLVFFTDEHFVFFFDLLRKHPLKEFDTELLLLVQKTSDCTLNKNTPEEIKHVPLEIIWDLMQDKGGAVEEVFDHATQALCSIFETFASRLEEQRPSFITLCIENIRASVSVPQSLRLLKVLLSASAGGRRRAGAVSTEELIMQLEEDVQLVALIFEELVKYEEAAKKAGSGPETDVESRLLPGFYAHKEHVSARLDFLTFVMRNYNLDMDAVSIEQVSGLWNCLVESPLSPNDRDQAFRWLCDGCERLLLSPDVIEYVFKHRLVAFDFSQISQIGFNCFERYFRAINSAAKRLGMGHEPERFVVTDFDLEGIDSLWDVALCALDSSIANNAVAYLCKLLDRLSPQLADSQAELRRSYITKLMTKLDEATTLKLSIGVVSAEFRILRCIVLLQKLLSDYDAKMSMTKRGYGVPMSVYVKFHDGKQDTTVCISIYRTDKLSDVRAVIMKKFASRVNRDTQTVNVCLRGKVLPETEYERTVQELKIEQTTLLSAKLVDKDTDDRQDRRKGNCFFAVDPSDVDSPRLYLSHEEACFAKLFDLLDFNQVVGEKVWELISEIPVNPEKHEAVLHIDESTNWDELLHTSSTFKLLYMLRIIESITSKPEEEDVAVWYASFLSTKGFERLYHILIHQDEMLKGEQRLPCLEALLHLVNSFMLTEDGDAFTLKETFEWIDYNIVVSELIRIIWASAKGGEGARASDADIVGHSSALLVACMASKPDLLETFFTFPGFDDFIRCGVLESQEQAIRSEMSAAIMLLCKSTAFSESPFKPQPRFVPLFLSLLSRIEPESQVCTEYFNLTNVLVQHVLSEEEEEASSSLDLQKLAQELTTLIKDHAIVEDMKNEKVDFVLVGLMQLLSTVLGGSKDVQSWCASLGSGGLVQHVFFDCLFELPTAEHHGAMSPPKCKSNRARLAAFDLLSALIQGNADGYVEVMALINEHHLSSPNMYREWNYSPGNLERAPLGYAGIKNLGCICYMNSLMQQLFMMPNFRRAILSLPIPEDTEELKKEDNVTFQIQRLFTFLQETQKQCYDPIDLCKSIKDYDGNPTDVFVQMDVDEFFNVLCDKVEQDLKLCGQEKLLENTWSGKVCTQLICQECKYVSERDESYYTVSLDIKNRTNIEEALEQYVQGEMLEGDNAYFCEKCDRKVSALMRRCVKTLPSTLILHLKRFDFDFDTMRKLKLNDYFEFPMDLEMKAYTKEGLAKKEQEEAEKEGKEAPKSDAEEQADEYYNYKLMGILVHRGVADSGHYYSFIQKRGGKAGEEPTWIEFNDDIVLPFDVEDIDRECFGGSEELPISDTMSRHTKVVTRTQNAYMLIYERADAAPKDLEEAPAKQEMAISRKNEEEFAVAAPTTLYEEVWEQNVKFLRDMKVFDKDYFTFNLNLLRVSKIEACLVYERRPVEEFAVIANAMRFLTEILVHSKEKEHVARLVQELKLKLEKHIPACIWVLEQLTTGSRLLTLLLRCTVKETRELVARLITHVVRLLLPYEEEAFLSDEEGPGELDPADYLYDDDEMAKHSAVTFRLLEKMLSFFFTLSGYWKNFSEFFLLLRDFAKTGPVAREYLFRRQVVPLIYNLVLYGSAFKLVRPPPLPLQARTLAIADPAQRKATKMGDKLQLPRFANALGVLVTLLQGSPVERSAVEGTLEEIHELCPYSICAVEELVEFPPQQLAMLFGSKHKLIRKAVLDPHNSAVLCRMLQYWSWNNVDNTVVAAELLRVGVNDVEYDQLTPWFALIFPYLSTTNDVLRDQRIAKLLDNLLTILEKFRNYPKFTRNLITNLFDMYEDSEDIRDIMDEQKERWNWVEGWMIQRHFSCRTFNQPKWSNAGYYGQDKGYDRGYGRGSSMYGL